MSILDYFKMATSGLAVIISLWALCNSYKTNRHKDNFAIAKKKYFDLLVETLPKNVTNIEYEPDGNIKKNTTIELLQSLDQLRAGIDHLIIIDTKKYRKIIKKLDLIDNNISALSTSLKKNNFKDTKEWREIMSSLSYVIRSLLLNV